MNPSHITLGGYQPPASVHNQAAGILGRELSRRLGDAVNFEIDDNMVESRGIKAMALPVMVEAGELWEVCFSSS